MKRLLAATDFSHRSERAVNRAALLAREHSAELLLLHVVDADQPADIVTQEVRLAEAQLKACADGLRESAGSAPAAVVRTGSAFQEIVRTATELGVDLVVMGSHRRNILKDVFVGTTIERVIRTGDCPVLMVNREPAERYGRVTAAVDMSEASANALRAARTLGLLEGAHVSLLHAFDSITRGLLVYANVEREKVEEHALREAETVRRDLLEFVAGLGLEGLAPNVRIEEGPVFHAIMTAVKRDRPDLLVIGTRGLTGVKRLLLGSVADAILRTADCDVLAVPPKAA